MARRLSREEGLFIGWSCGSAMHGALRWARKNLKKDDLMVVLLPDHGTRYLGKIYNDSWMKDHGYLEKREFATAQDILRSRNGSSELVTISASTSVGDAIKILSERGISQIPVTKDEEFVGSLTDSKLLHKLIEEPELRSEPVSELMDKPFQFVSSRDTLDVLSSLIDKENKALLVRDQLNQVHIITQSDLLVAMSS